MGTEMVGPSSRSTDRVSSVTVTFMILAKPTISTAPGGAHLNSQIEFRSSRARPPKHPARTIAQKSGRCQPEHERVEPAVRVAGDDLVLVEGNELISDRTVRAGRRAGEGRSRTGTTEGGASCVGSHVGPIDNPGSALARKDGIVGTPDANQRRERKPGASCDNVAHPPPAQEFGREPIGADVRNMVQEVHVPVVAQVKTRGALVDPGIQGAGSFEFSLVRAIGEIRLTLGGVERFAPGVRALELQSAAQSLLQY